MRLIRKKTRSFVCEEFQHMVTEMTSRPNLYNPFTEEHEMFRRSVRNFVEKEINPYCDEWEERGEAPCTTFSRRWPSWAS
jgi:alkylation response protein AidB-like acyl-CoA dehydrogenase